jgi:hypothetical protein
MAVWLEWYVKYIRFWDELVDVSAIGMGMVYVLLLSHCRWTGYGRARIGRTHGGGSVSVQNLSRLRFKAAQILLDI